MWETEEDKREREHYERVVPPELRHLITGPTKPEDRLKPGQSVLVTVRYCSPAEVRDTWTPSR